MHDASMMQDMMTGMFWGGVVMALPPVALCIGVAIYLYRRYRATRATGSRGEG
jgi:hypothetical protein